MFYLIGLGLGKESISVEGFNAVKKCKKVYLDTFTSVYEGSKEELEKLFNKKIKKVDRDFVENKINELFNKSKKENVAFLVIGDIYSASTHISIYLRAKKEKIPIKIINGVSILTAVGITGLSLYNFGKVISIPFNNEKIKSPYDSFLINKKNNFHTLFLLDLDPENNKFLSIKEACNYLIQNGAKKETLAVGCARLGFQDYKIKTDTLNSLKKENFGSPPYCLIIPGKLHFIEEEAINLWK